MLSLFLGLTSLILTIQGVNLECCETCEEVGECQLGLPFIFSKRCGNEVFWPDFCFDEPQRDTCYCAQGWYPNTFSPLAVVSFAEDICVRGLTTADNPDHGKWMCTNTQRCSPDRLLAKPCPADYYKQFINISHF